MYTVLYIINSNYFALLTVAMFPFPSFRSFRFLSSLPRLLPPSLFFVPCLFFSLSFLCSVPSCISPSLVPTPISEIQLGDVGELQAPQLVYAEPDRQMLLLNVQAESMHFLSLT